MSEPLTRLSDEEALFAETVRQFAREVLAPRAHAMDAAGRLDPEIPPQCFELGLMGIEIPEDLGGAGASFFMACLAVARGRLAQHDNVGGHESTTQPHPVVCSRRVRSRATGSIIRSM